jgi:hypothetical protein
MGRALFAAGPGFLRLDRECFAAGLEESAAGPAASKAGWEEFPVAREGRNPRCCANKQGGRCATMCQWLGNA